MRNLFRVRLSPGALLWMCGALLAASSIVVFGIWAAEWHAIQRLEALGASVWDADGCTACSDGETSKQFVALSHAGSDDARALFCDDVALGDEALGYASRIRRLREIWLNGSRIGDRGFAQLSKLHDVVFLDLTDTALSDAEIVHLRQMSGLECLDIDSTQVSGSGLSHLRELKNLKCIMAERCKINDLGLVDGFRALQRISLRNCPLVNARVLGCSSLESIELDSKSLRSVTIADSTALKSIRIDCIQGRWDPVPLHLRIENLPCLTSLNLAVDDLSEAVVQGVPALESVSIKIADSCSQLLQDVANESRLKEVSLHYLDESARNEALSALARSRSRESIMRFSLLGSWDSESVGRAESIGQLVEFPELRHLDLSNCDLLDVDLDVIERLPRVEVLNISRNDRLSAAIIEKLLRSRSLRTLVVALNSDEFPDWLDAARKQAGHQIQFTVEYE